MVQDRDGNESPAELDHLRNSLSSFYQPDGILEQMWVEKIVHCWWRLSRAARFESGLIQKALAKHRYDIEQAKSDDEALGKSPSQNSELDLLVDHLALPDRLEVDKLLRYEMMNNKELKYAVAELERLQSRRRKSASRSFVKSDDTVEGD